MIKEGESVVIDLAAVRSSSELLDLLGQVLELGGPNGNIPVASVNAEKGWGMNWNALYDSLTYLDTGGIWGNSHKFGFPLHIQLRGSERYKASDATGFETLTSVLEDTRAFYARNGKRFAFTFL